MDLVAVLGGLSVYVVFLENFEVDLVICSERLAYCIEALPRPLQPVAKPMDGNAVVAEAQAVVCSLELLA